MPAFFLSLLEDAIATKVYLQDIKPQFHARVVCNFTCIYVEWHDMRGEERRDEIQKTRKKRDRAWCLRDVALNV